MIDMFEFYKGKKVFVTGHTGFKGSWLCRMLVISGAKVTGYALKSETDSLFSNSEVESEINSVIGDIRDFESLKKCFDDAQPEIVFHLAAQPIVRTSYEQPQYTYETNIMGTVNLLECIRLSDCVRSFVNVTTDKVYENCENGNAFTESDRLCGFDPYSNSKSCSELITYSYLNSFFKDRNIAVSTARAGNVIGGGDFAKDRLVPDCIRSYLRNEPIIIRNPLSVRPFQYVIEPLCAYMLIAQEQYKNKALSGNYNIGPDIDDCISVGELCDIFCKYSGATWVNKYDGGPHEAGFLSLDCKKLKDTFGWKPVWKVDEAVRRTVEFVNITQNSEAMPSVMEKQINDFIKSAGNIYD